MTVDTGPARRRGRPGGQGPPLSAAGSRVRRRGGWRRMGEPGVPAEAEGAVDQDLVAADGEVGADLEVGPAQLVLDLLVALLDPVPDAIQAHDLDQPGRRVRAVGIARAAGPGRLVTRYQVAWSGRVPGSAVATTRRRTPSGPHSPKVTSAAHQASACPSRKVLVTGCQSPGSSGPPQASARAASTGVCASAARAQVPRRGRRAITNGSPASASSARNPS